MVFWSISTHDANSQVAWSVPRVYSKGVSRLPIPSISLQGGEQIPPVSSKASQIHGQRRLSWFEVTFSFLPFVFDYWSSFNEIHDPAGSRLLICSTGIVKPGHIITVTVFEAVSPVPNSSYVVRAPHAGFHPVIAGERVFAPGQPALHRPCAEIVPPLMIGA